MPISYLVKLWKARRLLKEIKKRKKEIEIVIASKHFSKEEKYQYLVISCEEVRKLESRLNVAGYGLTSIRKKS